MGRIARLDFEDRARIELMHPISRLRLQLDRAKPRSMSKRCSDWPSDASFFHGGRWVSIDEETRPIGTRPRIGTVSTSHFQVQIDGIHHSRSTSRRKTVREARVRTAAIVERDATMGGGWPLPGPALPRCGCAALGFVEALVSSFSSPCQTRRTRCHSTVHSSAPDVSIGSATPTRSAPQNRKDLRTSSCTPNFAERTNLCIGAFGRRAVFLRVQSDRVPRRPRTHLTPSHAPSTCRRSQTSVACCTTRSTGPWSVMPACDASLRPAPTPRKVLGMVSIRPSNL